MHAPATTIIEGISKLITTYETFILDQWGVLHFGQKAHSSVIDALKNLKQLGKTTIILSNSGKGAEYSRKRLEELGIGPKLYTDFVTSGEMVRQGLMKKEGPVFKSLGRRCLLISAKNDRTTVEGLDLDVTDDPANADFILMTGCDNRTKSVQDYERLLRDCAAKGLKMICANPDMVAVDGVETHYGPGQIAARYTDFGGVVDYIGKPHKPIFAYALSLVPEGLPSSTIMIGDSMGHDILGGAAMGFDTCLTMTGAHAAHFNATEGDRAKIQNTVAKLARQYGAAPSFVIPRFTW